MTIQKITPRRYRKQFRGKPDHGPTIIRTHNADGTWSDRVSDVIRSDMARPVAPVATLEELDADRDREIEREE